MEPPTSSADTAAAVAAVIDSARAPAAAPPPPARDLGGRPALPPEQLSMKPEAIRARRRRLAAKTAPPDARPKFTASMVRDEPAPTERPAAPSAPTATPEQLADSRKFLVRALKMGGSIAAKLLRDDAMNVSDEDADDVARQVIDGYPELAILDADGKKWLAWFAVISLLVAKWGALQRGRASTRPAGEPVAVIQPPTPTAPTAPTAQAGALW